MSFLKPPKPALCRIITASSTPLGASLTIRAIPYFRSALAQQNIRSRITSSAASSVHASVPMAMSAPPEPVRFLTTPYPVFSHGTRPVRTAACVVIGDEILNGKTLDTNSHHLGALLFSLGISLRRIEVVPDEEEAIVSCVRRLCEQEGEFDMLVTSGGIGPTHDDITYQSLAKVFDPAGELTHHAETIARMDASRKTRGPVPEDQRAARRRMALFPARDAEVLFVQPDLWVPVVCLRQKVFVLPGVPTLFQQLIQALVCHYIPLPPETEKPHRVMVQTTLPESSIAPFLSSLAAKVADENIKLGSYPNLVTGLVSVSLIGSDPNRLKQLSDEVKSEFDKLLNDPTPPT